MAVKTQIEIFCDLLLEGDRSGPKSSNPPVRHEFAPFQILKACGVTTSGGGVACSRIFLAGRTFEPDQIAVMSAAFADTCKALGLSETNHPLVPLVARHVMGLGERGVKTRAVIYLLTLEEFRPYRQ